MVLLFTYDLKMLPESPVEREGIESIIAKLMEAFPHCKPLDTCYFLKVLPEHIPLLYNELGEIATKLHDNAIAELHYVMNSVNFEDEGFQYQFLKDKSACVRALFTPEDQDDDTQEIE